ncbi:unnamed protein product, partial [Ectocarpus sp. 12 AP-2014]
LPEAFTNQLSPAGALLCFAGAGPGTKCGVSLLPRRGCCCGWGCHRLDASSGRCWRCCSCCVVVMVVLLRPLLAAAIDLRKVEVLPVVDDPSARRKCNSSLFLGSLLPLSTESPTPPPARWCR